MRFLSLLLVMCMATWTMAFHETGPSQNHCSGGYDDGLTCTTLATSSTECWFDEDGDTYGDCIAVDWAVKPGDLVSPTDPDFVAGTDTPLSAGRSFVHTGSLALTCGTSSCGGNSCVQGLCSGSTDECLVNSDCSRCADTGYQCQTAADCSSAGRMAIVDDDLMYCDEDGAVRTLAKTQYNSIIGGYEILGDTGIDAFEDMVIDINEATQRGTLRLVPKVLAAGTHTAAVNVTCPLTADTASINLATCDPDAIVRSCLYTDSTGYASNDGFCFDYYGAVIGGLISVYETAPLTFTTDAKLSANSMVLEADGDLTTPADIAASGNISDDSPWLLVTKTTDGGTNKCTSGCTVYGADTKVPWGTTGTEDADAKGTGLAWDSANHEVDVTLAGDYKVTVTEMVALGGLNNNHTLIIWSNDGSDVIENSCKVDPPVTTIGYNSCVAFIDNMASGEMIRVESYGYFNVHTDAGSTIEVEWLGP